MPPKLGISSVPQRWVVCAMCSWAIAFVTFKTATYNGIAKIVNSLIETKRAEEETSDSCPFDYSTRSWERRELPVYLPDVYYFIGAIQTNVYEVGVTLTAVPAGVLSDLGYPKYVLIGGTFLSVSKYFLLPLLDKFVAMFVVLSFFEGLGTGCVFPSVFTLIARWAPPSKRNTFTVLVMAGKFYGAILGNVFFRVIYTSWSFGERTTGTIGLLLVALSSVLVYNSPKRECDVINGNRRPLSSPLTRTLRDIPWLKIITSVSFLGIALAYSSVDRMLSVNHRDYLWYYQRYVLHLPFTHFSTIMNFAVLPILLMGGFLADWINRHKFASMIIVRRVYLFVGVLFSSVLMGAAYLEGCNVSMFWTLTVASSYSQGLGFCAVYTAAVDLSTHHAGLLMGIAISLKYLFELLIDAIFQDASPTSTWSIRKPYFIKFAIFTTLSFAMAIPFLFLGSGETQIWELSSPATTQPLNPGPIKLEAIDEPKHSSKDLDKSLKGERGS